MAGLEDTGHRGAPGNRPLGGSHMGRHYRKLGWPEQAATRRQEGGSRPGNLRKTSTTFGTKETTGESV